MSINYLKPLKMINMILLSKFPYNFLDDIVYQFQ